MARLTAPNGAPVSVADDKVEALLARGFTAVKEEKAPTKPTRSRKAAKSDDK